MRFLFVLIASACLAAQEPAKPAAEKPKPAAEKEESVQKVFPIRYVDPNQLFELLRIFEATIVPNRELKMLAVRGRPSAVAAIEEALKRLDVPAQSPPNVEVIAYLLEASAKGESGGSLPQELQSVVKQLRSVFPYQSYRVLETPLIRTRVGRPAQVGGGLSFGPPEVPKSNYSFEFNSASATPGSGGNIIRLERLRFSFRVPVPVIGRSADPQFNFQDTGIYTDLDMREGQKVVVGKATAAERGYFLVVTAKVVD